VATLTLNRPQTLNGLDVAMQRALLDALRQLQGRTELRALVITGAGKAFSAGGDLRQLIEPRSDGKSMQDGIADMVVELSNPLVQALQQLPMATVCAVNGVAAGAGASLALAADVTVAARSAFFLLPFIPRLGILPDLGMTWFAARGVSRARASAMVMLGERIPADTAAQWGLIWSCVDDAKLRDQTQELARRLAALPPHGALQARQALQAAYCNSLNAQLELEAERQRELLALPSFVEGVQAFLEKREPRFRAA
jgi:2-(1,2-epoxy-1,2-dihydrophenyl)acetyl-CoA isomerase